MNLHPTTFLLLLALFTVRFSISSVSFGRSRKPHDFELRSILDQFFDTPHGSEVLAQRRAERGAPSGRVWPQTREMTHAVDTGRLGDSGASLAPATPGLEPLIILAGRPSPCSRAA